MTALKRNDFYLLSFLLLVVLVIFYPVFYTEYAYTDEVTLLTNYRPGSGFTSFTAQGRGIMEFFISTSYSAINTIREISYIRAFALFMWLACVPIWYITVKRMAANGPGYEYLPFFTCLYLVTSLPFSITVQWTSCMQLSIANTAALLSGAVWYNSIKDKETWWSIPVGAALASVVLGLIAMFAYQSGFGCFLVPFLLHYISAYTTRKDMVLIKGLAFYVIMYAVYFVVFRLSLIVFHVPGDSRTGVSLNPEKIIWFFWQPLKRAFWFNLVFSNDNVLARVMYFMLFAGWIILAYIRFGKDRLQAVKYIVAVILVFMASYLPGLVVKENYSSNRTLLAIDMCVWIVCAEMVLYVVKNVQVRKVTGFSLAAVLVIAGWYNFNRQFLKPIHEEYTSVKRYVQQHYNKNITTVYFIKPAEDAFRKKYHIALSMDEFGVPSTFFNWVPEPMVKLLVYEKSGNREEAGQLTVKQWQDEESFKASGEKVTASTLVVNIPEILSAVE